MHVNSNIMNQVYLYAKSGNHDIFPILFMVYTFDKLAGLQIPVNEHKTSSLHSI